MMEAVDVNKEYIFDMFEKCFDTDKKTVDDCLNQMRIINGKSYTVDKCRLQAILKALEPSLSSFCFKTDNERKHKVASKLLGKLDYDAFYKGESYAKTRERLEEVYNYTTGKNINVYKIIGSTMLIEANMMVERKGESKKEITDAYEWAPRMVWNIYDAVSNIGFTDEETIDIFEHAKTIFSKGLSTSIDSFDGCVLDGYFTFKLNGEKYNFLDRKTFKQTIKNCQTILVYSADKVKINIEYMLNRTLREIAYLGKENHFEFKEEKLSDGQIAAKFVQNAIAQKASLLTAKVVRDEYDEKTIKSDDIDGYVNKNFVKFITKDLRIDVVNDKEDEDEKLDETELFAKYGNNFGEGLSDADRNAYYRMVGREDKIAEDDTIKL